LVRRFTFALIAGLLALSVSGVCSLVVNEPCTGYELSVSDDGACPPTCATCGCCAQAVDTVTVVVAALPDLPIAEIPVFLSRLPQTIQRDILHVPKPV
jgi:hypothetical protein